MDSKILDILMDITEEEERNLLGQKHKNMERIVTSPEGDIIDRRKVMKQGRLIDVRKHPRFAAFPRHHHSFIEIIYMFSGASTHVVNDTHQIVLKKGELLFLGPDVAHEIKATDYGDVALNIMILPEFLNYPILNMEGDDMLRSFLLGEVDEGTRIADYMHFQVSGILPIQNLVENMVWCILKRKHNLQSVLQATMATMFLHLMNHTDKINTKDPKQYEQNIVFTVYKYIADNYQTATLEEFSVLMRQPDYYVSKLIKKHAGKNFKQILQQKRLNQAAYYLMHTGLPVDQIIERVGYDNSSYFHKKFKEYYGVTPKKYRDNYREENNDKNTVGKLGE